MKTLCPGPSVMEVLTWTNSLQAEVHQLAKKLDSSKATARHIKQVSREPQATQINLLHHQRTDLPQHRYKKKRSQKKNPGWVTINPHTEMTNTMVQHTIRTMVTANHQFQTDHHCQTTSIDVQSVETLHITRDSHAPLRSTNARHATNLDILPVNASKGNNIHNIN